MSNLTQPPTLFNRLGSAGQVGTSVLGVAGTFTGGGTNEYAAVEFGNGYRNDTNFEGADYVQAIDLDQGCIECYIKMADNAGIQGTAAFWGTTVNASHPPSCRFLYSISGSQFISNFFVNATKRLDLGVTAANAGFTSADQVIHCAVVWDATGGSGAIANADDVISLYFDGVLMSSFSTNSTGGSITYEDMQGASISEFAISYANTTGSPNDCYIDNLKYYDYAKTNFDDRRDERGGLRDQVINS